MMVKIAPKLRVVDRILDLFDLCLVATMIDNGIKGIYTKDTKYFEKFEFLEVKSL